MSQAETLRDNVATAVAALPEVTARSITPRTTWMPPEREVKDVASGGEIWVAPAGRETTVISRNSTLDVLAVHVAIMQSLGEDPDTIAEDNQDVAEAILTGLITKKAGTLTCVEGRQLQIAEVDHWRTKRLFTTILELRYR